MSLGGRALVVAGHGSLKNPNTRRPVDGVVERIGALGVFDEVVGGFWKEAVFFRDVLGGLVSREVTIVPFFMSEGFYTRVVLPREFSLSGDVSLVNGAEVRLTQAIGVDGGMADIIVRRGREGQVDVRETLIVLGHGTPRHSESGSTTEDQAERVREGGVFAEVLTGFIDQAPFVGDVIGEAAFEDVVIVPFFVADGWHVTETLPRDLGVEEGVGVYAGKRVRCTRAVGTEASLYRVVLALAEGRGI